MLQIKATKASSCKLNRKSPALAESTKSGKQTRSAENAALEFINSLEFGSEE